MIFGNTFQIGNLRLKGLSSYLQEFIETVNCVNYSLKTIFFWFTAKYQSALLQDAVGMEIFACYTQIKIFIGTFLH